MILTRKFGVFNLSMNGLHKQKPCKQNLYGFTLIELMITVAIVGIIASVAYPSYMSSIARSDRTEAQRELVRLANLQEQYFSDNRAYTTDMTKLTLPITALTESKKYKITAIISASTFTLTATAQGNQATNDPNCTTLSINETGKKTGASTNCWER